MKKQTLRKPFTLTATAAMLASVMAPTAFAQSTDDAALVLEEITIIGSRREGRSAADSTAPVDIILGETFRQNSSTDIQDLLRTSVPSFTVDAQPINDESTISRPANLRGLSPDNTLVLLNGKRRHRGSVISFLGGGIADGAQGVDISTMPSLALKQVQVLRDGASSQYGSDAIAGVINFELNDAAEGGTVEAQFGSTFEGDGDTTRIAANVGFPLGENGFLNVTAELGESDGTSRSVQRADVNALIAAGNTAAADFRTINQFTDEVPQYWGSPDIEDDNKIFFNAGIDLNENTELYAFGNVAERTVQGGFFYRNPTNRGGVYSIDGGATLLVGDLLDAADGINDGSAACPTINVVNNAPDPVALAAVAANPNCFTFFETIPGGFNPRFGGDVTDVSFATGLRGEFANGLNYDFSVIYGSNETDFQINNTVNPSLGANSPRNFDAGSQKQTEVTINADFAYAIEAGLASDLNIAFGAEYRDEEFEISQGDAASFAIGPLASQGFGTGSNGFGGRAANSTNSQDSYAMYIDLEADVTERLTLQAALRYEDYSTFGDSVDGKLAGLFRVTDSFRIRGAVSTGFHAPTAGQATVQNVSTTINTSNNTLFDQGTLPLNSPAGQLAADFIESQGNGRPSLGTEEATNISLGLAFDLGASTWTVDFYDIDLEGRVTPGNSVSFLNALNFAAGGANFSSVSQAISALDAAGTINRADFAGLESLLTFNFFSNTFDTNTQGVDIVGRYGFELGSGTSDLTLALNFNDTEVTNRGTLNPISQGRVNALENRIPASKGSLTWVHTQNKFRTLVRANYFGEWDDTGEGSGPGFENLDSKILVDVEVAYAITDGFELIVGANNIFDEFPEEHPRASAGNSGGARYLPNSPYGFNGGGYYLKGRYSF